MTDWRHLVDVSRVTDAERQAAEQARLTSQLSELDIEVVCVLVSLSW